ncbi:MAG: FtsX-like permease family protein [Candidatus Coatesbacteria bacterium]
MAARAPSRNRRIAPALRHVPAPYNGPERRANGRYSLTLHGRGTFLSVPTRWLHEKEAFEVVAEDVSLGGMQVHFNEPVRAGDAVRLKFTVPGRGAIELDTVVRWVHREPGSRLADTSAGLAFNDDAPHKDIEALLHASDYSRGGASSGTGGVTAMTRQVNLPLRRAIEISIRSLRIRTTRTLATSAVVMFAIWFLTLMLCSGPVSAALEIGEIITKESRAQDLWVVIVSMLVAVVGITNTLHMSVAERYREIGTMKCLGALDRFVVELFLLESLALGAVGSVAGAFCGMVHAIYPWLTRAKELDHVALPVKALLENFGLGVAAGLALTILGSLYPAFRAARMAPAEAMRTEV